MLETMIRQICSVVVLVEDKWTEINRYVNDLLSEDATILQGDEFVQLLFENDSFSRSRKYFWILACLKDFENVIEHAENYWREFKESYLHPYKESISNIGRDVEEIDASIASLKRIRMGFGATREEVKMLRDGVSLS